MTAYWFRVIGAEDGQPTGYIGMVVGASADDLFWAIDEFADPYCVEVATCNFGGFCLHLATDGDEVTSSKFETSDRMPFPDDSDVRWRVPPWVGRARSRA